jgi:PAS domain S-box-containing protein
LDNKSDKITRLNQVNVDEQEEEKFNLFYKSMFQNIKVAIVWFDLKGEIFKINPYFVEMLGYKQDEVLGKPITSVITTVVKEEEKSFLSRILKGEGLATTTDLLQKNGQVISAIMQSGPLLEKQNIVGGYLIFTDITPYKLSQARAKERESRLQTLIDKSRMGVVIIDQEHRVIETNKRFAEMLGYPLSEMYKLHTWDWEAIMNEAQIREVFKDFLKLILPLKPSIDVRMARFMM